MKDTKVVWPSAIVTLAGGPILLQFDPPMYRLNFTSAVDDLYEVNINGFPVTDYMLSQDHFSVSFLLPAGIIESVRILGRPRNLSGAHALVALRGQHAVVGADKLLQMIVRLSKTGKGDLLGREDIWGKPDLGNATEDTVADVVTSAMYHMAQVIMRSQSTRLDIPPSERLADIQVLQVYRMANGDIRANVRIDTLAGPLLWMLSWGG